MKLYAEGCYILNIYTKSASSKDKMGNSLKHILIIGITIVVMVVFIIGNFLTKFIVSNTIEPVITLEHQFIAKQYTTQIWCKFSSIFDKLKTIDVPRWKDDEYFQKFSRLSYTVLSNSGPEKISLFNQNGIDFFSTNQGNLVFFGITPPQDNSKMISTYIPQMGIYSNDTDAKKSDYIYSKFKLDPKDCGDDKIIRDQAPTIELLTNIDAVSKNLFWFKIAVSLIITIIFSIFYLSLYFTEKKTEKIINKQLEEKVNLEKAKSFAESQNQEKSMFLANVSHELRTPLNAIIGFSNIIKDEVMGPVGHQQYKEYITDINSSGIHLLSLINDILDYSKAEAHKLELETVDVDLTKTAQNCVRLMQPRANEAKVHLIANVPDRPVILSADPKRMKQIMLNLLSNAVKFTAEAGTVTLTVKEDVLAETVQVSVVDTGIGIAAKDISKAMSPFGQIDSSLSRRYEGTGLGLPLTKKLTDIMGGKFDIQSEVGVGTSITLVFSLKKSKKSLDKKGF